MGVSCSRLIGVKTYRRGLTKGCEGSMVRMGGVFGMFVGVIDVSVSLLGDSVFFLLDDLRC